MGEKRWGDEPYFGLGTDWDPDWLLTERQLELRDLADRAVREGDAREREGLRRHADVPAAQPRAAR